MKKITLIMISALLMTGCSIKMAYNNMDRLIRWGVSDYVDLNRAQKNVLNREIRKFQYWHRVNHLPEYAAYMEVLATTMTDTVSVAQMQGIFDQVTSWAEEVEEEVTPLIIEMMASLTDEQIAKLPEKLEESNLEIAESELDSDLETAQAAWAKELEESMKQFIGRLTPEQKSYIARRSSGYMPERALWADYRRRFQADLLALLESRDNFDAFATGYRALVDARESYYGEELTKRFDHNQQLGFEVSAYVLSDLTEKQSAKFVRELTELGEDFAELAAEAEPPAAGR